VSRDFFASDFFRESSSPDNNSIRVISRFFSKIRGDICNLRCTTGVNCPFKWENFANAPHLHVEGSALLHGGDPVAVVEPHRVLGRVDVE
jgi:hypothetical protein